MYTYYYYHYLLYIIVNKTFSRVCTLDTSLEIGVTVFYMVAYKTKFTKPFKD